MKNVYLAKKPAETKKLGENLAKKILEKGPGPKAFVIGLEGELGAGKTTFLQGFAKGLGVKEKILSPTFVIFKKFPIPPEESRQVGIYGASNFQFPIKNRNSQCPISGKNKIFKFFYHFDCYRIKSPKEILELGFKEIISEPENIVVVEWADIIKKILPFNTFLLNFEFIDEKKRKITIRSSKVKSQSAKPQRKTRSRNFFSFEL